MQTSALTVVKEQFEYHAFVLQVSVYIYSVNNRRKKRVLIFVILLHTRGLGSVFLKRRAPAYIHCTYVWKTAKSLVWKTRIRIIGFYFAAIGENRQFWSEWLLSDKTVFSRTRHKESWLKYTLAFLATVLQHFYKHSKFKDWIWPL